MFMKHMYEKMEDTASAEAESIHKAIIQKSDELEEVDYLLVPSVFSVTAATEAHAQNQHKFQ